MLRTLLSIAALSSLMFAHTAAAQGPAGAAPKGQPAPVVNLNTATAKELEVLPGIGAKTAGRIIEYRQKNGPFKKIEELMNVGGIGEKSFLRLKPQLTVGAPKADRPADSAAR